MTIVQIQSDEDLRRQQFPIASQAVYLAHAGVCPLPARVSSAITDYANECARGDQETAAPVRLIENTRHLASKLLGVQADEISLVGPTSVALSMVASGLNVSPGDNVLVYFDDYPTNVYPWMALSERGVDVRPLRVRQLGRIEPNDVLEQIDERTRLVALASCHFVSGWRIEHAEIGRALHDRNVLFCLDAIQTLGAAPVSAADVDFLAADAHKWLLGPCAAGILYVRKEVRDILKPTQWGWNNLLCPNYVAQERLVWQPGAQRYEAGTANLLGLAGLKVALELVLEVGIEAIAGELRRQRECLIAPLEARGYEVLHATAPPRNTAGILSFSRPDVDARALHRRLLEHGIVTSLRGDRSGKWHIRISPHFYNTDSELQRLLQLL